jgi:hypothetical protein
MEGLQIPPSGLRTLINTHKYIMQSLRSETIEYYINTTDGSADEQRYKLCAEFHDTDFTDDIVNFLNDRIGIPKFKLDIDFNDDEIFTVYITSVYTLCVPGKKPKLMIQFELIFENDNHDVVAVCDYLGVQVLNNLQSSLSEVIDTVVDAIDKLIEHSKNL